MHKFVIDAENRVSAYVAAEKAAGPTHGDTFANANDLARLASGWPGTRLVEIWNQLPNVKKVRRFTDRKTAIKRIWKAVQDRQLFDGPTRSAAGKRRSKTGVDDERQPTKTERIVALLKRPSGATLQEIMAATNWQAHSVRGFLSQLRRRSGHRIKSFRRGTERAYRIGWTRVVRLKGE